MVINAISTHTPLARCDTAICLYERVPDISTHTPLARCDAELAVAQKKIQISTHTPLARCDVQILELGPVAMLISTHTPLARCDPLGKIFDAFFVFQLTHLSRGVTPAGAAESRADAHFNSHTSREV